MPQPLKHNTQPFFYETFATLADIHGALEALERAFPLPPHFLLGVKELMVNAVEHGNLEIGYALKNQLLQQGRWHEEIDRRLKLEKNRHKKAALYVTMSNDTLQVDVRDAGAGFDYHAFITQAQQQGQHKPQQKSGPSADVLNGRGLHVACALAFDSVEFTEGGHRVVAYRHRYAPKDA